MSLQTPAVEAVGTTTSTLEFGQLAFTTTGATTSLFDNIWVYLRGLSGTASAGAATTITTQSDTTGLANTDLFDGWTVYIVSGTGSGQTRTVTSVSAANPAVVTVSAAWTTNPDSTSVYAIFPGSVGRRIAKVQTGGLTVASGIITVTPPLLGAASGVLFIPSRADFLFCRDLNPDELKKSINYALRNMVYPALLPVTAVTDGDMEDTGVTNWAAIGAPTTREKTTSSYPFQFGRQALHIVSSALAQGATCNNIAVQEGEPIRFAVQVKLVSGSVNVILYNATGAIAIRTVTLNAEVLPQEVRMLGESVPSSSRNISVRFESATASSEWYVGPVHVNFPDRRRYSIDTVEQAHDIKRVLALPAGVQSQDVSYSYAASPQALYEIPFGVERDDRGGSPINVILPLGLSDPPYVEVMRRYPELTNDYDLTTANQDTVTLGAMARLERLRAAQMGGSNPALAGFHRSEAKDYAVRFRNRPEVPSGIEVQILPSERTMVALP